MFDNFKKAVLADYEKKKKSDDISENLLNPSRAKLRAECFIALDKHYKAEDDEILKQFFDPFKKYESHKLSIQKFDGDGFKSIIDFFAGNVVVRKEENVKLLAWLINYEHRPYHSGWVAPLVTEVGEDPNPPIGELKFWQKPIFISGSIMVALVLFGYLIWQFNFNTSSSTPKSNEKCMFWTGNHFEPIDCGESKKYKIVETLDIQRLHGFKKIFFKDLLNKKDIGKVHLLNGVDGPEYFTQNGIYPKDPARKLRPLSIYMLTKYSSFPRFLLWLSIALLLAIVIVIAIIRIVYSYHIKKNNSIKP